MEAGDGAIARLNESQIVLTDCKQKDKPLQNNLQGLLTRRLLFLQQFQDLLVRFVDLRIADGRKIDAGRFFRSVSHCFRDDGHGDVLAVCQARPGMPGNIGRQFDG